MKRPVDMLKVLLALSVAGLFVSIYSYLQHYGVASSGFCKINETFDCDIVNKGPYGTFMGLPVALIGVVGYGLLVAGFFVKSRKQDDRELTRFLLMATLSGLIFALYLTGIEAFVLHAYCLVCLASQFIILTISVLLIRFWIQEQAAKHL